MSRLPLLDTTTAPARAATLLQQIDGAMGGTPNMFRLVANSPAALASMWGSFGALGGGTLGAALGEQLAVAIAERNRCAYCLAAHTALGTKAGVSASALAAAQHGESSDPRTAAALRFALAVVDQRGHVGADAVEAMRAAGFSDAAIVEIVAHVALNVFTNYVNSVFGTPVDFPAVPLRAAA